MHRDQLPGAHRTPHARSGQALCQYRKSAHRARRNQREGARSHFRHWEPGRCPLLPIAWLSLIHSRPMQAHRAAPAAEPRRCQGDVDSTYPPWSPRSRLRRRGLSAPSSRFFDGSAKKVPQTLSARLRRTHVCTGWMALSGRQARSLTRVNCGRLHSSLTPAIPIWPAPQPACPPVDIP